MHDSWNTRHRFRNRIAKGRRTFCMKARYLLAAKACATGFKLTKEGEEWHKDFVSIPQALLFARSHKTETAELIVTNFEGRKVAHFRL